jgi:cytosine/adenosine deaminase-related metal-dependent hydrolase
VQLLRARLTLAPDGAWVDGGGVAIRGERIARLLRTPREFERARRGARIVDLGDVALVPGLVNAHAHLELSGLAGRVPASDGFGAWLRRLVELRRQRTPSELAADARAGARRCSETGTTSVGDIDTNGGSERGLRRPPLRVRLYRELLDLHDPERTKAMLRRARGVRTRRGRVEPGLAPHTPFTASEPLLEAAARVAQQKRWPVTVHWSETVEEVEWLRHGRGPLAAIFRESPRAHGLALLDRAGLLRPGTSLVHGNHPQPGEPLLLAQRGVVLVHCPGSHAFFGRAPFPIERYLRAGVTLALGTDSLASNDDLDLRREMRLLREAHPAIAPSAVWAMATLGGARALGWEGRVGALSAGAQADLAAFRVAHGPVSEVLDEITAHEPELAVVWVGGTPNRRWSSA